MSKGGHVLLTNDDGFDAPGLRALAQAAADLGFRVTVVAPLSPMSGASRARYSNVSVPWSPGDPIAGHPVIRVAGTPAACVIFAMTSGLVAPIDLCLSGVNAGPNLGAQLTASGTFGAALEAAAFGLRGIAVSRQFGTGLNGPASWDWSWVARATADAVDYALSQPSDWMTANINLPESDDLGRPVLSTISRASYYKDVYDAERHMITSRPDYSREALEEGDDIHVFAEQRRTSVTLLP